MNDDYNSAVPNNPNAPGIIDAHGHRIIDGMIQPGARRRFQNNAIVG